MTYLFRRGNGARRRVVHLAVHDPITGKPTMQPLCGRGNNVDLNTTSNVPWRLRLCKRCEAALR